LLPGVLRQQRRFLLNPIHINERYQYTTKLFKSQDNIWSLADINPVLGGEV